MGRRTEGAIASNPTCRSTQAFLQDEVLYSAMLQMNEGLQLRADPLPRRLLAHSALARHTSALTWGGFSKYSVCVGQIVENYFAQNSAGVGTA